MIRNPDNWPIEISVVTDARRDNSGGYSVTQDNGWTFWVSGEEVEKAGVPQVGEGTVTLGGIGFEIRGIFIGGREYRYTTREEADAQRIAWLADYEARKRATYEANIDSWVERMYVLDEPFRSRLLRFQNADPEKFWLEDGGYELFAVEQANKLYRVAVSKPNPEVWLNNFKNELSFEKQKAMFPELDEGHSGNTFGAAVALARAVLRGDSI